MIKRTLLTLVAALIIALLSDSISAFALAFPSTSPNDLGAYFSTHFNLMHPV
jgi:hypothetical protein